MKHHGEIVETAVRASGVSISRLAKKLGVTRQTVYNYFHSQTIPWDTIRQIGDYINHDFSQEVKENGKKYNIDTNFPFQFKDDAQEASFWRYKYIELLEKYNALLAAEQPAK
jgi:AcrR family transcriptional regulator